MTISTLRSTYQLKITLQGSEPPIWRRFLVADDTTLGELHEVIQDVMGWDNYHLHMFIANGERYGPNDEDDEWMEEQRDETQYKIRDLLRHEKDALMYEYDFGDGWLHKLVLEKVLPFDKQQKLPVCITGKRACPPEDCGGLWGHQELIETLKNPGTAEYEEYLEWLGFKYDPEHFDLDKINKQLGA